MGDVDRLAGEQLGRIGGGGRAGRALEQFLGGVLRGEAEDPVAEAHAPGERLRHVEVRARLALRLGGLPAPLHPVGAVGAIEIVGLEVVRRRQHDVGVLRRVGHEGIVHHGEQVLAQKALLHLVDLGAGHRRIVGRHVERADRRVLHVQKLFAQAQVIDVARRGRPRGPADGGVVEVARRRGQQQRAAALDGVVARHARQQRHGAQRLAAMRESRHAFAEADHRGLGLAVHRRELLDVGDGEAGDLGDALPARTSAGSRARPCRSPACAWRCSRGRRACRAPGCA